MHLLVIRLSAIGDVALSIPVLEAMRRQHPGVRITVVSQQFLKPLFKPLAVDFVAADIRGRHKGVAGLRKLFRELTTDQHFDAVIDLHSVLRSHILGSFFKLKGVKVHQIDKGRSGKKALTRKENKIREPQKHSSQRYADVFRQAGFPLDFNPSHHPLPSYQSHEAEQLWEDFDRPAKALGIAPLASFPGKAWPLQKMAAVIQSLHQKGYTIFLFGGPDDREKLHTLEQSLKNVHTLAGRLTFDGEVAFMKKLKCMVAMDSGNMHLATLAGIPTVSIWGATHPYAGFAPLGENEAGMVQIDPSDLSCRPCSVFGKKPCFREDYACLNRIEVDSVLQTIAFVSKLN